MKHIAKCLFVNFSKLFLGLFYNKEYLKGRHFTYSDISGWLWAYRCLWDQKVKGYNKHIPFPVHPTCVIGRIENLFFDIDNIDNFWKCGSYFQCWDGKIHIGKGVWIAQNVGIITQNHTFDNLDEHYEPNDVYIGNNCWIGMNSVILPGVHLGENTIVGAGAVVTHSFEEGHCVIAGNPAKIIRKL